MSDIFPPANWPIPQRRWRHQQGHAPMTNEEHPSAKWKQQDRARRFRAYTLCAQSRQVQAVPATHIRRQHIASGAGRNESRCPARASILGNARALLWTKTAESTRRTSFYEHPLVLPQVMQRWHEPLRTMSEPQLGHGGPSPTFTISASAWTGSVSGCETGSAGRMPKRFPDSASRNRALIRRKR